MNDGGAAGPGKNYWPCNSQKNMIDRILAGQLPRLGRENYYPYVEKGFVGHPERTMMTNHEN